MKARVVPAAAALVIAGLAVVDVVRPVADPVPVRVPEDLPAGSLACPFGLLSRGNAFLHLANVGEAASRARITLVPDEGDPGVMAVVVQPRSVRTVRLHGRVEGAGAVFVDWAGGRMVGSHSIRPPGGRAAAGVCAQASPARVAVAHGITTGVETNLAVANAGTADADVSITLLVDGEALAPESLTRRVIPPYSRRVFRLADFVFQGADVTAVVETAAGRVAAETLVSSGQGVSLRSGGVPLRRVVQMFGPQTQGRSVSVVSVGDAEDTGLDGRAITPDEQGQAPDVPPVLVPGSSVRLRLDDRVAAGPAAYVLDVSVGSPVATGASWLRDRRGSSDRAGVEGVEPARTWAGVIGATADGDVRVLLANPGDAPAGVRLTVLTDEGEEGVDVSIPAGRTASRRIGRTSGTYGVLVESNVAVAVALDVAIFRPSVAAYAVLATPLHPPRAVSVRLDQNAGVPGRLPGAD